MKSNQNYGQDLNPMTPHPNSPNQKRVSGGQPPLTFAEIFKDAPIGKFAQLAQLLMRPSKGGPGPGGKP